VVVGVGSALLEMEQPGQLNRAAPSSASPTPAPLQEVDKGDERANANFREHGEE